MAKVRIGIATAFELENELVGIGTDNPTNTLQALGNIQSSDAKAIGVSTLTTYQGFVDTKLILQGSGGAKSGTTSGEIIIEGEVTVSTGTTFTSGPENLTVTDNFTLPGISDDKPTVGTTRFNENLGSLEFYTGAEWRAVNSYIDNGNRGRGVMMGGSVATPSYVYSTYVEYVTISSKGNSTNYGDLTDDYAFGSGCASETRGLHGGGEAPSASDSIEYITIASSGNAIDFGNLTATKVGSDALSSSTRGIWVGGSPNPNANIIDFVEIATTGNAVDFGDVNAAKQTQHASFSSPTRGVWGGGEAPGVTARIRSITIASKGNSTDFGGELINAQRRSNNCGCSNSVRGLVFGGYNNGTITINTIQYITIASNGNAQYFGDLSQARESNGSFASQIRGICSGGRYQPNNLSVNTMEFVEISSTGKAMDFGDLSEPNGKVWHSTCSDSHGGLGGY